MSLSLVNIYAAAPATERAKATVLTTDAKGEKIVYGCGNIVFIRNIKNPLITEIYTEHAHAVNVARFSPSGFYIASGDAGGNVRIWATDNADKTLKLETRAVSGCVKDIAWSDDSKRLAVVGDGKDSFANVFIWDSGSTIGTISGHSKQINSVDWKQTRPYRIATASEDFLVNFYEGPPFKFAHSNKSHSRFVNCVRFSPDGNKFVSVGSDVKAFVYDGKTGQPIGELQSAENPHKMGIYSVCWSPDSKFIMTASGDKTVKVWDGNDYSLKNTFAFSNDTEYMQVGSVWVKDQLISLSLNGDFNYLDQSNPAQPSKIVYGHNKLVNSLTFDRNTNTLYSASNDGTVIAWEVGVGSKGKLRGKGHTTAISTLHVVNGQLLTCGKDDSIRLSDVSSFTYGDAIATMDGTPQDIAVGKADNSVFIAVTTKSIGIIKNGKLVDTINVNYNPITVDISNDDSEVLIGSTDNKIRVYAFNGSSLTEKTVLAEHRGQVSRLRYSPDGTLFASGDSNRELIVWDNSTKKPKYTNLVFHNARILDISWSQDSSKVATGSVDTHVIVWDLAAGTRFMAKGAHPGGATSVAFINENTIASAGSDSCVKTWRISN